MRHKLHFKSILLALLAFFAYGNLNAQISDLIFSEYIEGSSNNKAIEIYNGTGADINLDAYRIKGSANGGGWKETAYTFPEGTIIKNGEVLVIANNQADASILAVADLIYAYNEAEYTVGFNGNDARALETTTDGGTTWTIIDVIGLPDSDSNYDVAGVVGAAKDHTLIRKTTVTSGNADWTASAGTNTEDSEWIVYDKDYFDHLGMWEQTGPVMPKIYINEVLAKASDDSPDWIEIYNAGSADVDLTGMYLSDDPENPTMWQIPASDAGLTTIPAKGFVVFYADESGSDELHTNFKLSKGGETITLHYTDGTSKLDEVTYEDLDDDIAYARFPDGDSQWIKTESPTPGAANVKPPTTIYNIQFTEDASGNSPLDGQIVTTSGIVTATFSSGYYIQNGTGPWSGVYVYDKSNTPTVGDNITVTAEVDEYFNLTELKNVSELVINSSGNELPAATIITEMNESYEGVLVKIKNYSCTALDYDQYTKAEFKSADETYTVLVNNTIYSEFAPVVGTSYTITGVGDFNRDNYKIQPRSASDVTEPVVSDKPSLYINELLAKASDGPDWIEIYNAGSEAFDIGGMYITDDPANPTLWQIPATQADSTTIAAGGFIVLIADDYNGSVLSIDLKLSKSGESLVLYLSDGSTIVDEITFGEQEENISYGRYPDGGSEWMAMPEMTHGEANKNPVSSTKIYDIQYTTDETGDSPQKGQVVTTSGIVTAVFSSGYYIQDGEGAWNGVYVYDKTNTPAVGDNIMITCEVDEYYNLTELKNVTEFSILSSGNNLPAATLINEMDESFEGVLVKFENYTCTNVDIDDKNNAEFKSADEAFTILVHNQIFKDLAPVAGHKYNVTGLGNFDWGNYKIEPREAIDVVDLSTGNVPQIFINEFTAKVTDDAGTEIADWIELYNAGTEDIDLAGMYMTDDLSNPTMWQIPATNAEMTTIPAGGYLIIYADETGSDEIHAAFKLKRKGESIGLYTTEGQVVDTLTYTEQTENISYGRYPDGGSTWEFSDVPTPGATNVLPVKEVSIYEIQFTEDASGDSPYKGKEVVTSGIVTGIVYRNEAISAYYIQNGEGAWNGVYVYDNQHQEIAQGDHITIKTVVDEYFGLTELKDVSELTVNSSGNALPMPLMITPANMNESLEGVLVKAINLTCVNVDFDEHDNSLYTAEGVTDTLMAHDQMYEWEPLLNSNYSLTGIVNYDWSNLKIEPRDENDVELLAAVQNPPVIGSVTLDPAEPVAGTEFTFAIEVTDDIEVASVKLYYGTSAEALDNEVELIQIGYSSNYGVELNIENQGTVYYKVVAVDDIALTAEAEGSFDVDQDVGIHFSANEKIKIYPNPVKDVLFFENLNQVSKIEITNIMGQAVETRELNGMTEARIDVSHLNSGIYMAVLHNGNQKIRVIKILKK